MMIGIDEVNKSSLYGCIHVALVMVKPDFFRKHSYLKIKDSKKLSRSRRDTIFEKTKDKVQYQIRGIKPSEMLYNNLNALEMKNIIDMLNRIPKFWQHKIHIDNFEVSKEKFEWRFKGLLPHNLSKVDLNLAKWKVEHKADEKYKVVQLASIYARNSWDKELDYIQSLYGKIGMGSPADLKVLKFVYENIEKLPYFIRKSYISIKRLSDKKELNKLKQKLKKEKLI